MAKLSAPALVIGGLISATVIGGVIYAIVATTPPKPNNGNASTSPATPLQATKPPTSSLVNPGGTMTVRYDKFEDVSTATVDFADGCMLNVYWKGNSPDARQTREDSVTLLFWENSFDPRGDLIIVLDDKERVRIPCTRTAGAYKLTPDIVRKILAATTAELSRTRKAITEQQRTMLVDAVSFLPSPGK